MVTIFDKIFGYEIGGVIPVWVIAVIALVVFVIWLVLTRVPRTKEYKEIDLKKEIKDELNINYKYFSNIVGKPIYAGLIKIGYAIGYMPILWNNQSKRYEPIMKLNPMKMKEKMETASKEVYEKYFKDLSDVQKKNIRELARQELKDEYVEIVKDGEKTKIVRGKNEVIDNEQVPCFVFKVCNAGMLSKMKASLLGFGIKYFIVEQTLVTINDNSIQFQDGLQRQLFFEQFIFTKTGKNIVDNTAFRIDRENQLKEIANQIPRTVFFDIEAAKRASFMREQAQIETERWQHQKEGQQD